MNKYKLIIFAYDSCYVTCLYEKSWPKFILGGWKFIDRQRSNVPINEMTISWQKKYNIPDKRILINFQHLLKQNQNDKH